MEVSRLIKSKGSKKRGRDLLKKKNSREDDLLPHPLSALNTLTHCTQTRTLFINKMQWKCAMHVLRNLISLFQCTRKNESNTAIFSVSLILQYHFQFFLSVLSGGNSAPLLHFTPPPSFLPSSLLSTTTTTHSPSSPFTIQSLIWMRRKKSSGMA